MPDKTIPESDLQILLTLSRGHRLDYRVIHDEGVWDDIRVRSTDLQVGGALIPDWAKVVDDGGGSTGVFAWHLDNTVIEALHFGIQIPHRYKAGTDIYPHIHWAPKTGAAGSVRFNLEYWISNVDETPAANSTIIGVTAVAPGVALQQKVASLPVISGATLRESSMLLGRIERDPTDGDDDYGADAILFELDFHAQMEKHGTQEMWPA